jgi:hypothetical protein
VSLSNVAAAPGGTGAAVQLPGGASVLPGTGASNAGFQGQGSTPSSAALPRLPPLSFSGTGALSAPARGNSLPAPPVTPASAPALPVPLQAPAPRAAEVSSGGSRGEQQGALRRVGKHCPYLRLGQATSVRCFL